MAVNSQKNNLGYGISNALQNLSPLPIIARRAPSSNDVGELGQVWVYNDEVWMFTSKSSWTQLAAAGNEGTFTELTVNGDTALNGAVIMTTGDEAIIMDSGTGLIDIGTDAAAKDITIGNITGATSLTLLSGTGGMILDTNSTGDIDIEGNYLGGISYTFTNNARIGTQYIVVPADILQDDVITLTMSNSFASLITGQLVTVTTNATGGGRLQVLGVVSTNAGGGGLIITCKNVGSATIPASTTNVIVSFIILGGTI